MKILYIITQADGGGAQKYVLALAKHFGGAIAAGNEASLLFNEAHNSQLTTHNLKHLMRDIHPLHDFLAVWEIRELIKKLRPDIVHLNSSKAGILGSFAAIGLKTKVVFTAHGFIFNEPMSWVKKSFYLSLEKTASSYRDFIITVSEADRKSALDVNLINSGKISTIHNGLEPIEFFSRDEARLGLPLSAGEGRGEGFRLVIGTVANFYKTKGLDILIEAVKMLDEQTLVKTRFAIIGDGPEKKNLELGIRNYGLQNSIYILGKIDNAERYLSAFDIFVLASRKEGFPYVLLEAMQAGLPIIATNVGGNSEALGDAAILVESENPRGLAQAITNLITDEQKRKDLSQKSLDRSKIFTETKMLEETEKVYNSL